MKLSDLTSEGWEFIIDRVEKLPQGVNLYYKNIPYPRRVYYDKLNDPNYTLRALEALGRVKKYLFALTFLRNCVFPYRFNAKSWEPFLRHLYLQFEWDLIDFNLKEKDFSVPVWEMGKLISKFLMGLGFSEELSKSYSRVAMLILEFDNAYRYRFQDLLGDTYHIMIKDLQKGIKLLLEIYKKRDTFNTEVWDFGARGKIIRGFQLLGLLCRIPKIKNALIDALKIIDIEKIKFNNDDRFHVSFWKGYDFEGKTFEQRFEPYSDIFKNAPFKKRQDPGVLLNFMTGN